MGDLVRKADVLPIFCMRCVRVIDCVNDVTGQFKNNCPIKKEVDELPSAEPEIVRCKDCKHSEAETDTSGKTGLICHATYDEYGCWADVKPEHFCGYAERGSE